MIKTLIAFLLSSIIFISMTVWIMYGEELDPSSKFLICYLGLMFIGFSTSVTYINTKK